MSNTGHFWRGVSGGHRICRNCGHYDHEIGHLPCPFSRSDNYVATSMTKPIDELLTKPFKPCVAVLDDPKCTEMVLSDAAVVWKPHGSVDLGYDVETFDLVAIRVFGDVSRLK